MSFEEGFDAIARVKASGEKLGETINRIAALESWLTELRAAQNGAGEIFEQAKTAIQGLGEISGEIAVQQKALAEEVDALPALIQQLLSTAENRLAQQQEKTEQMLAQQQRETERILAQLPTVVDAAIETKLTAIVAQMEVRLNERLRDELKDTRTTLRETLEYGNSRTDMRLDEMKKDIIAQLPRGLFSRRGG